MKRKFDPSILKAEIEASKIIEKYGINEPHDIRLRDIAFDQYIQVVEAPLSAAAASLVTIGNQGIIRINSSEKYKYRKRFSLAHELGHFALGHGHTLRKVCSDSDMNTWYNKSEEAQANAFASELLLPQKLISSFCDVDSTDISFEIVLQMSNIFRVSLTATAIRFVRFCPEPCAIVFSKDDKISWSWGSEEWWPFVQNGAKLDNDSIAHMWFQDGSIPNEPIEIPGDSWASDRAPEYIMEHSIAAPSQGFVLSLLWIES